LSPADKLTVAYIVGVAMGTMLGVVVATLWSNWTDWKGWVG